MGGVISPPLSNIYLGVLDKLWERRHAHLGELVRYCDDVVILCRNTTACEEAEGKVREILRRVYFLQPRPSPRSMQRVRQRVKETLGRNRNVVKDVRVIIRDVSRVRGIRMHGLNGGTVLSPASQGKG